LGHAGQLIHSAAASDRTQTDYASFARQLDTALPANAKVLLGVIPDPYLALLRRSDLQLRELAPDGILRSDAEYAAQVERSEFVVLGRAAPTAAVQRALDDHALLQAQIGQPQGTGYFARVYQVQPRTAP